MCRNSVVNVVEIEKESISTTVTTCLRPYGNQTINFQINETILVQNFRGKPKWLEAVMIERTGPVSYTVQIGEEIAKRHVDQILYRKHSQPSKLS